MKKCAILAFAAASASALFAEAVVPSVTNVGISQDASRNVTISYTLANAPAVVTFDIQTNYVDGGETKWVSIGGRNIDCYFGDGNCLVSENGTRKIVWHPEKSWPDRKIAAGGVRAVVTAWATLTVITTWASVSAWLALWLNITLWLLNESLA